ncbi:unnamed protein product [Gulo gulo]|uniref:Uncharacterized protein n=1 Tax=Gulo gulo TaxID=48420 RepID=A0A9X9PXU8_GULGU|nr:unnamed protein product [Gulo gulo]
MKHFVPQFPSVLAIYCFCMVQIPSSVAVLAILPSVVSCTNEMKTSFKSAKD